MDENLPEIAIVLLKWFEMYGRENLPWRSKNLTPYQVWVSEIMLQQTQVSRVVPYYEKFLVRFSTVENLAKTSWEDFLPYYAGLGYYRRGRNMLLAAQQVVEKFGGEFPKDKEKLRSLPGIGEYTASAILSFGFNEPHLAFDTNQQRVFGRVLYGNKKAEINVAEIESALGEKTHYQKLNAAIMDFANAICTRSPQCEICPLRDICVYVKTNGELEETFPKTKHKFPLKDAQVYLFLHRDHKEYFSENLQEYEPFILPITLTSRAQIKEYFKRKFDLDLAVRPPHFQGYKNEQPIMFVNAQILLGSQQFSTYQKSLAQPIAQQLKNEMVEC